MRVDSINFKTLSEIEELSIDSFGGAFDTKEVTAHNFVYERENSCYATELAIFKIHGEYLVPVKNDVPTIYGSGFCGQGLAIFDIGLVDLIPNESYVTVLKTLNYDIPENPIEQYVKSVIWVKK